jgi:hypothetical protein
MTSRAEFKETVPLQHRYELVLLFDVTNGNPNGDPDADNQPRVDPETGNGLVTDVCIKRKVRNFVTLTQRDAEGYEIYVKERGILANQQKRAYTALGIEPDGKKIDVDVQALFRCAHFRGSNDHRQGRAGRGRRARQARPEQGRKAVELRPGAWSRAVRVRAFHRSDRQPGTHHYARRPDQRQRCEGRRANH